MTFFQEKHAIFGILIFLVKIGKAGSFFFVAVELNQIWENKCSRFCSCPTTNGDMQNESSVKTCTHCMHVFARSAPICTLSRCLLTKFLHRSSVGSLLRVRCWLGAEGRKGEGHQLIPTSSIFIIWSAASALFLSLPACRLFLDLDRAKGASW